MISEPVTVPIGRNKNLTLLRFNLKTIHTYTQERMPTHTYTHTQSATQKNRLHDSYLECLYFCRVVQKKTVCGAASKYGWLLVIIDLCALYTSS
jgi:hypothetical protein